MRRSDLPAKNDDAVLPFVRVMAFAGKSDRRTARSYGVCAGAEGYDVLKR